MSPAEILVEDGGLQTTVQDADGRLGYWMVGVPPSGAMDAYSLALGNRIVANQPGAAGLECTVTGPTLRFATETIVALTGADTGATVDGRPVPLWEPLPIPAGAVLRLGRLRGPGMRTYVAVRGGIDVPLVLGSRATFTLGGFGGHQGRELQDGDQLPIGMATLDLTPFPLRDAARPDITTSWDLRVCEGPHGAPEFITSDGIEALLTTRWEVQTHAARTGVRLSGPAPDWARTDGGDAGLHPSNIHDTGYAFGAVDFTGDTPVILGPDGPSLGGFTCPFTVIRADRWKLGQLAPGDSVTLVPVDAATAARARDEQSTTIRLLRPPDSRSSNGTTRSRDGGRLPVEPVTGTESDVLFRRAGDDFVLVEFGSMTLDLELRARVHGLERWLAERSVPGLIDLTAGIRSLLIHLDPDTLTADEVVTLVRSALDDQPDPADLVVPGRIVHLPLSWEDPSTIEAIERYMTVVRDDAPWCPSNIEFIRRVNGLASADDVRRIVFDASYLVLGLGDVYLGAPVSTPLDPRHRLVTTKYNPARTWTPQNAVGIGGAYLCVYGMEGPGGYQFVGRTVPVWYLDGPTPGPDPETPWLLRAFDQLRFHPVSAEELVDLRHRATAGSLELKIEPIDFSLAEHQARLRADRASIEEFRATQREAFDQERARWREGGELV